MLKQVELNICLIGNPNTGKSTLFNALTGLSQKVGNFSGVTVEKKSGKLYISNILENSRYTLKITDLPGIYSLYSNTLDEQVAVEYILNEAKLDICVCLIDASNIKQGLFLATELIDLKLPVVVAVNRMDLLESQALDINLDKLSEELGVPVIGISARNRDGLTSLKQLLCKTLSPSEKQFYTPENFDSYKLFVENYYSKTQVSKNSFSKESTIRYEAINTIIKSIFEKKPIIRLQLLSQKLDSLFTHKVWGYVIFSVILFTVFQFLYNFSAVPQQFIESGFEWLTETLNAFLPKSMLTNLLVDGVIAGIGGIVVFLPQIAFLFFFITILEDSGYMARVSFIMDKLMRKVGLNGKSVIPLLGGIACAVPSIMATRTIESYKERLITILVTPIISCSARLPVYILLINLVIPDTKIFIFNLKGLALFGLYLLSFIVAFGGAWLLNKLIKTSKKTVFILPLPLYQLPDWGVVFSTVFNKCKVFLLDAGKVILAVSVILWVLCNYAPGSKFKEIDAKYATIEKTDSVSLEISKEKLEHSYAGLIGKTIEPAITPLGWDWKVGIALITSFAAREVFTGTMATIYSQSGENDKNLTQKMQADTHSVTHKKLFTLGSGVGLMLFYAFAMQCASTMGIVYKETGSWKFVIFQFIGMGLLAYVSALCAVLLL